MTYAVIAGCIAASVGPSGRSLFWVGGTGNSNDTAHYSLSSGGSGGQPVPTSADNVTWDGSSGGGTVTFNAAYTSKDFNSSAYTGTLAGSSAMSIFGSFTLGASITRSFTSPITFSAIASGKTITSNGKTYASTITFNGVGGGWTLQDTFNMGSSTLTLTNGSLNTNGQAVTCLTISSSNSNVRTLTCGASTFTMSGGITFTTSTNLTFLAASATFNVSGSNGIDLGSTAASIGALNLTNNSLSVTAPTLINRSGSDVTIGTLTRTNTSSGTVLVMSGNFTITNTLTFTGTNVLSSRQTIVNANPGITCQITATGATKTFTNCDFYGITAVGNTPWTGTSMGDCGGNSGITFDSPVTCYFVTSGASNFWIQQNWSSTSGGPANTIRNPLPQDTAVFDANSFPATGRTVSLISMIAIPGIDFTNVTNSPALAVPNNTKIFGDLKLISSVSVSGTGVLIFSKWNGTQTLTTAGVSIGCSIQIMVGGTFVFADAPTITGAGITFTSGTLNDGNFNVTTPLFSISLTTLSANKVFNKGTGTYILTGANTVWNVVSGSTTNLTFSDSGTIKLTNNSSTNKTISPGGLTYNNFWNATSGSGVVIMNNDSTNSAWNDFKIDAGRTQQFKAATTTTFSTFTAVGTAGNVITIASSTAASHNLVSSSGTAVNCDYMSITNSHASGATFVATNSVDGGGNTGWIILPVGFLSTWNTANAGVSGSNQVQLPFVSTGTYNCTVYWGDGTSDVITSWNQAQTLHTYASPGTYKIAITGTCHGFNFSGSGDCLKILNIAKWDILRLGNDGAYFDGCSNLTITATDNLDLTGTTTLAAMFLSCSSITTIPSINTWTTSSVTDFSSMFYACSSFNQALSFNTSAATTMQNMFNSCSVFNSSVTFTTTSVTDFSFMFDFCFVFNQPLAFNTSAGQNMSYMLDNCTAFNQDLSGFVITSMTSADHMMDGVTLSNANYNALLVSWSGQTTPKNNVTFSAGNSHYSGAGVAARGVLTGTYGWIITDGGTP